MKQMVEAPPKWLAELSSIRMKDEVTSIKKSRSYAQCRISAGILIPDCGFLTRDGEPVIIGGHIIGGFTFTIAVGNVRDLSSLVSPREYS